ncbi:hypothetical protein B0H17DRAFT_1155239 [Mycena rosella]|uniref:Uncharacterized protein n=1 Tax=Mycena rosella TaxID=1033263 RepID=A0AAD7AWJ3_MYCRO|nr:hypothetical protein B0H17DRAFT_1155239 [Mycena rosella]
MSHSTQCGGARCTPVRCARWRHIHAGPSDVQCGGVFEQDGGGRCTPVQTQGRGACKVHMGKVVAFGLRPGDVPHLPKKAKFLPACGAWDIPRPQLGSPHPSSETSPERRRTLEKHLPRASYSIRNNLSLRAMHKRETHEGCNVGQWKKSGHVTGILVRAVRETYLHTVQPHSECETPLADIAPHIHKYWKQRKNDKDIVRLLSHHHIDSSKYGLGCYSLTRFREIREALGLFGSRKDGHDVESIRPAMLRLRQQYPKAGAREIVSLLFHEENMNVSRNLVTEYFAMYEPEFVKERRKNRLQRKRFWAAGVNDIWAVDLTSTSETKNPCGSSARGTCRRMPRHSLKGGWVAGTPYFTFRTNSQDASKMCLNT